MKTATQNQECARAPVTPQRDVKNLPWLEPLSTVDQKRTLYRADIIWPKSITFYIKMSAILLFVSIHHQQFAYLLV